MAVSVASFHLLEEPIRQGGLRPTRSSATAGRPPRRPWLPELAFAGSGAAACCAVILAATSIPPIGTGSTPKPRLPLLAAAHSDTRVLLVGDSMAYSLGLGLIDVASRYDVLVADEGVPGCSVSIEGTYVIGEGDLSPITFCNGDTSSASNWRSLWARWVNEFDPDVVVYLARADLFDQLHNGSFEHIGEPDFDRYLISTLHQAVSILHSRGAQVVLMTTPYYYADELPSGDPLPEDNPARADTFNHILQQVAASYPGIVSTYDLNSLVSPGGKYTSVINGITIRSADGVHFTNAGGEWLAPQVLPTLVTLGRSHHAHSQGGSFPSPPAPTS